LKNNFFDPDFDFTKGLVLIIDIDNDAHNNNIITTIMMTITMPIMSTAF
jgi:hypothetical protein